MPARIHAVLSGRGEKAASARIALFAFVVRVVSAAIAFLSAGVYFVTIVLNLGMNTMLIPIYGLYGAALATALAMIIEAIALYVVARRRLGPKLFSLAGPTQAGADEKAGQ